MIRAAVAPSNLLFFCCFFFEDEDLAVTTGDAQRRGERCDSRRRVRAPAIILSMSHRESDGLKFEYLV